jgi:hypothetical protein
VRENESYIGRDLMEIADDFETYAYTVLFDITHFQPILTENGYA